MYYLFTKMGRYLWLLGAHSGYICNYRPCKSNAWQKSIMLSAFQTFTIVCDDICINVFCVILIVHGHTESFIYEFSEL